MAEHGTKKGGRIIRILFGVVLTIILAIVLFQAYGVEMTRGYIINKVRGETIGRYELILNDLDFSVLGGTVHLRGIEFKRDTTVDTYVGISFLDKFDIDAKIGSLDVTSFKLFRFALLNQINVHDLQLVDPVITIKKNRDYTDEEERRAGNSELLAADSEKEVTVLADSLAMKELQEASKEFFPPITVDNLIVLRGAFAFFGGEVDYPIQKVEGLNLKLKGVYYEDGKRIYTAEDLSFEVDSASTLVSQNMAKLSFKGLHISTTAIHIDRLHYGHVISAAAVNRIKGFRASWLNIEVDHIDLPIADVDKMIEDSSLLIPRLNIENVNLHFFKHKYEKRINPGYKALPQELVQGIPYRFALDSLVVDNATVLIEMLATDAKHPGQLTLDTSKLTLTNMTNIPLRISTNPVMELNLTTKLMREAPASVNFKFDLNSDDLGYNTILKAGPMRASLLNDFLGSQVFIEFRSGFIDRIDLRYHGNKRANVGKMDFEYTNLRVRQLEDAEKYIDGKPKTGFLSGVANVIISKNNTPDMKKYKGGLVYYEREYNRDFMHGMIMSLVSGLMSTLGLGNQKEAKIQDKLNALDDQSMQDSAVRAQRKADQADADRVDDKEKRERQDKKQKDRAEESSAKKDDKAKKKAKKKNEEDKIDK